MHILHTHVCVGLDDSNGGDVNQSSSQNVMMLHLWIPLSFYPLCYHYRVPFSTVKPSQGRWKVQVESVILLCLVYNEYREMQRSLHS